MKELLILRHAKSSWDAPAVDDFERPLAPRGEKEAPRMGAYLAAIAFVPDLIVSSPARRASQTAQKVAKAAGFKGDIAFDQRIYLANPDTLLEVVCALPETAGRVLLVGHNPGFEELVAALCGGAVRLTTAALACVELPATAAWVDVERASGVLLWLVTPKTLA